MYGAAERNEKEQILPDPCSHSDLLDDMCLQCGKTILKDGDDENLQYRYMPLVLNYSYYADLFSCIGWRRKS